MCSFKNNVSKTFWSNGGIRSPEVTITQVAGRLTLFRDNWEKVTQDQWVLDEVTGYRIEFLSTPTQMSSPRVLLGRAGSHKRGDQQDAIQRGNNRATPRGSKLRVLLEPVPGSKEGRGYEASDKPEEPQQVCGPTTFQDGRDPHSEGFAVKRRLDDKDRSEGRLLHDIKQVGTSLLDRADCNPPLEFSCLPFGLSCAPWVFTMTLKPALTLLKVLHVGSGIHRRYSRLGGDRRSRGITPQG